MTMLAFFPWLRISAPVEAGRFELVPYTRGQRADADSLVVEAVTSPYLESPGSPVTSWTILRRAGAGVLADLGEGEINAAFMFAEQVALAGLAKRPLFDQTAYWNRDNFRLIVQRVSGDGGVAVGSRRRGGRKTSGFTPGVFIVPWPHHVDRHRVLIDVPFLKALVIYLGNEVGSEERESLAEGIVAFNAANTDTSTTSPQIELVQLTGSLEQALGCAHGKENDLASKFMAAFTPTVDVSPAESARLGEVARRGQLGSLTIRDAWIRDLFRLRGDFAHGKVEADYPAKWTTEEHLCLGSLVFPLVVKLLLSRAGAYRLSAADEVGLHAFEEIAGCRDLLVPLDPRGMSWPWNEEMYKVESRLTTEKVAAELRAIVASGRTIEEVIAEEEKGEPPAE